MKFRLLLCFLLIKSVLSNAQGYNNLWLLGYNNPSSIPFGGTTIDFFTGEFTSTYQSRIINYFGTNATISDVQGNLQFSTNGVFIMNANNDTMLNGSGLNPCFYTNYWKNFGLLIPQGAIVIPFPLDNTKYYLFHITSDDYGNSDCSMYLYCSVIDMTRDNGRGEVIQKNFSILNDSLVLGRLTACKHANGRDWWLFCHKNHSTTYYKFLITPGGITGPFSQNIGEIREVNYGQSCFSADGSTYAYYEPVFGDLDIFNFDRCTGDFSMLAHVDINDSASGGGVAFSPNSKVLYVTSWLYVYQFDLTSANIATSLDTVAEYDGYYSPHPPQATTFYLSYLAPDGKIYINSNNGALDMHVINNPDSLGDACNLFQHYIHLPSYNALTIPNYPNYFLGSAPGSICDSLINVNEVERNGAIKIFPNPVVGNSINVTYSPTLKNDKLLIYDVNGKICFQVLIPSMTTSQHISLPNSIVPGVYFATLSDEIMSRQKFVILEK